MLHKVNGSLKGLKAERLRQLQRQLQPLGYEFNQELSQFEKVGTLESAVNELVPIYEELGWDAEHDLVLEETVEDSAYSGKYVNGRVIREFPRGV